MSALRFWRRASWIRKLVRARESRVFRSMEDTISWMMLRARQLLLQGQQTRYSYLSEEAADSSLQGYLRVALEGTGNGIADPGRLGVAVWPTRAVAVGSRRTMAGQGSIVEAAAA